jgi:glycerol-3-phosphate dehydrogenase
MAEDTVDELGRQLPGLGDCQTRSLALHGAGATSLPRLGAVDPATEAHLRSRFGADAELVVALLDEDPSLAGRLIESLPYLKAEVVFAARHEMAIHLDDVLCRRMRAHLIDARATLAAAPAAAALMGAELGWDAGRIVSEVAGYEDLVRNDLGRAGLEVG